MLKDDIAKLHFFLLFEAHGTRFVCVSCPNMLLLAPTCSNRVLRHVCYRMERVGTSRNMLEHIERVATKSTKWHLEPFFTDKCEKNN